MADVRVPKDIFQTSNGYHREVKTVLLVLDGFSTNNDCSLLILEDSSQWIASGDGAPEPSATKELQ